MRNLYLINGDPMYPPHSGSRGADDFNRLLHQRKRMFGFTDNFDDYRNITDLDVLKDMYMKMKNAYREKQPKKEMPKGAPRERVSGKKTQEDTMSLQHKRGSNLENYRIMKERLSHLPSTDTFRDNATKMILPLASRKVRKKGYSKYEC